MTKRRSKELSFFSDPGELKPILEAVLSATGARLCRTEKREGRWFFREAASPEVSKNGVPQFYVCHPAMIKEGGLGSLANIVQVWFPMRVEGELRMGEVGMLVADSELDSQMRELQGEVYRALRKELLGASKREFGAGTQRPVASISTKTFLSRKTWRMRLELASSSDPSSETAS
ncbi:MAG: hypothetical protein JWL65_6858 [Gammaproteobacteria bacterium]|nr:hypothetical protein [Gammaproteobacteria bacterium]